MINYIIRRVLIMIPTLIAVSVLVFVVIQLPPGDIITSRLQELQAEGQDISEEQIAALRARYHLDDPMFIQYFKWIGGFLQGDMGYSVMYGQSVNNLIWERLGYTLLITSTATLLTWLVAFPVGVYSALRQYSALDYAATLAAFIGLATPNFLLALVLMYLGYEWFGDRRGRVVFSRIRECAVELGQIRRFSRTSMDPGRGHRHRRHGRG